MMTALLRTVVLGALLVVAYFPVLADEISPATVEKTYVKCTLNEKGEKVPNYFVVVNGVAHQTDSLTFFNIKKARNGEKKDMADNKELTK